MDFFVKSKCKDCSLYEEYDCGGGWCNQDDILASADDPACNGFEPRDEEE